MTDDNVLTLPRYYLTRDGEAFGLGDDSTVLLYPLDAIEGTDEHRRAGGPANSPLWGDSHDDAHDRNGWHYEVDDPTGGAWTFAGRWLVSDRELHLLRRSRPGRKVADGWIRRTEPRNPNDGPVSPELTAAHRDAPERPSPDNLAHYREHEAPHVCWQCAAFEATYTVRYVDGEREVHVQDMGEWRPLPGGEDPDPSREWISDAAHLVTLYGRHTAHLWPGRLTGLRDAVVEALREHPFVAGIHGPYSHDRGKMTVDVRVPFDPPRSTERRVKETPRSRTRTRLITEPVFGINTSVRDVIVPESVSAPSKAEAIEAWQRVVDRQVRRFVPVLATSRVCGHCDGLGVTDAGS